MQQVRDIKRRIESIEDIKQITKAMYAISMTKVFRLKQRLSAARLYADGAKQVLQRLCQDLAEPHPLLITEGEEIQETQKLQPQRSGVFLINSDRGLCGRFSGDLNRRTYELITGDGDIRLILGGEKARVYFEREKIPYIKQYIDFYGEPAYRHAKEIASDLFKLFKEGELRQILVVYMRFINDFSQEVVVERLLPLDTSLCFAQYNWHEVPRSALSKEVQEVEVQPQPKTVGAKRICLYEPSREEALLQFAPLYLRAQLFRMLLESKTSEQAIRRQAMKNATDNANELIKDLTLSFNKARQQEITREIADIIGGAEALKR